MTQLDPAQLFGPEHADSYESRFAPMAPIRDALQMLTRSALHRLPHDARILCAGVGTGLEMIDLARLHPGWTFVGADPAPAMLDNCLRAAEAAGVSDRCTLHDGYLDSLGDKGPFDGATSLLVSHFILDLDARQAYFAEIAKRLAPGGVLVAADLSCDPDGPAHDALMAAWCDVLRLIGQDDAAIASYTDNLAKGVRLVAPDDQAALIARAGFAPPTRIFQAGLIHGWRAQRA